MSTQTNTRSLTVFSLVMITVGSVDSVRNLPSTALFGSQLILFFILSALLFLVPCALVSAELASSYPEQGGIYIWVKKAFGKRMGFLAIWLQWIENVIWYPSLLSFVAGSVGYMLSPALIENPIFLFSVICCSFWGVTGLNLLGMQTSANFSTLCTLMGLLLPMSLIIGLGSVWMVSGQTLQIQFDLHSLLPHYQDSNAWVSLTAIMMSFCGIEIATVHANDVENPRKAFPTALFYSVVIICCTLILGSLSIAIVLPHDHISLVAGIMQAFDSFFHQYGLNWMMPLIALMLLLGGLGSVNNWIIAPTKGLLIAANEGNLPPVLQATNPHGAPTRILIIQALIVTLLSAAFLFMPSINSAYWLLTALAAQLYMYMYFIMFVTAIVLRARNGHQDSAFVIPGGMVGLCLVAGTGLLGTILTIIVSFIPPGDIYTGSNLQYALMLLGGALILCLPPLVMKDYSELP